MIELLFAFKRFVRLLFMRIDTPNVAKLARIRLVFGARRARAGRDVAEGRMSAFAAAQQLSIGSCEQGIHGHVETHGRS